MFPVVLLAASAPLTQAQCVARFDRALLTSNGALLRSVLHPKIIKNSPTSGAQIATFLKTVFWPALARPMAMGSDGSPIPVRSPANVLHFVFKDAAGWDTRIMNAGDRAPVFRPVTVRTSEGFRAVTDYAALAFFAAYTRANRLGRNGFEMQDAQGYVEAWAPQLQKLGIRGGSDGWKSRFEPWRVLLPNARNELDRMKPRR